MDFHSSLRTDEIASSAAVRIEQTPEMRVTITDTAQSDRSPAAPLRGAMLSAQRDIGTRWSTLCSAVHSNFCEAQDHLGGALQQIGHHIAAQQRQRQGPLSMLAVSDSFALYYCSKATDAFVRLSALLDAKP